MCIMLAGIKVVDKAAAEAALREEQRVKKKEKKQLKKVHLVDLCCGLVAYCLQTHDCSPDNQAAVIVALNWHD